MKTFRLAVFALMMLFIGSSIAVAGDFDWMQDFNAKANVDWSGFNAKLATRFQVSAVKINAVMDKVTDSADAYMVFKLGEMSHQPPEKVLDQYTANKGKRVQNHPPVLMWEAIAKNLGIKPESAEFKALKNGHDLDGGVKGKTDGNDKKGKVKK